MTGKEREELQAYFDGQFRKVDQRFDGMDQRFDKIEAHLDRQDAALEKTTINLLLTITEEGTNARRHADRLFAFVDRPLGHAIEGHEALDRPKRHPPARRRIK
jgi:hypothetical protein